MQGNTALAMPDDAGVVRIEESSGLGVALATDCNGRFGALDPYQGAQLALAEAYRNVAVAGAQPLAVTDCLNFGSPEDPGVMWQFERAVSGLADGCQVLGVPVTGGNVSFYNQTGEVAIHPTPVVGRARRARRRRPAHPLGLERPRAGGVPAGHHPGRAGRFGVGMGGARPPRRAAAAGRPRGGAVARPACWSTVRGRRLLAAAHDLSDGGLAQALVEASLRFGVGARVDLDGVCARDGVEAFVALWSESTARALVAVPADERARLEALCAQHGVPALRLGVTTAAGSLEVEGLFAVPLAELRAAHDATLPAAFEH